MRRSTVAAAVAIATLFTGAPLAPTSADESRPVPHLTLTVAREALAGRVADTSRRPVEATLALRDLFVALPTLTGADREGAHDVLARPTDGAGDPNGDGYRAPERRTCSGHFCLHWVTTTRDAPPDRAWVSKTMRTMGRVWAEQVGDLGYRRPVRDGRRGGSGDFDVYLKELGSRGLYGYCAPERRKPGHRWLASGYCVLDNDFARAQYGAPPGDTLRVTAAHEFFHAIQFAYDYGEDPWFMESTATWMEERIADDVNDNRQYLPYGQVRRPEQSLDLFVADGFNQYGNWPFFEFLSSRFGTGIVRRAWEQAGAYQGAPDRYSTRAVTHVLRDHGGFPDVFGRYAAANAAPGRTYAEGSSWPSAGISQRWQLSPTHRHEGHTFRLDHMAARNAVLRPEASLGRRWMARVTVDGPRGATDPTAYLVIRKRHGRDVTRALDLDADGHGTASFPFAHAAVAGVTLTLGNASTRFECWQRTTGSCQGRARDDDRRFDVGVTVYRR